jgi:hypothetical protein
MAIKPAKAMIGAKPKETCSVPHYVVNAGSSKKLICAYMLEILGTNGIIDAQKCNNCHQSG